MKGVSIGLFNDSYEPIIDGVTITVRNYAYWLNRTLGPTCVVAPAAPFYSGEEAFPEFASCRFLLSCTRPTASDCRISI